MYCFQFKSVLRDFRGTSHQQFSNQIIVLILHPGIKTILHKIVQNMYSLALKILLLLHLIFVIHILLFFWFGYMEIQIQSIPKGIYLLVC